MLAARVEKKATNKKTKNGIGQRVAVQGRNALILDLRAAQNDVEQRAAVEGRNALIIDLRASVPPNTAMNNESQFKAVMP